MMITCELEQGFTVTVIVLVLAKVMIDIPVGLSLVVA
jgi:hypothetical protein